MTTGIVSRVVACTPGDLAYPTLSPPDAGRRSRQWEAGGLGGRTCPRACVPTIASPVPLSRPAIARTHPEPRLMEMRAGIMCAN